MIDKVLSSLMPCLQDYSEVTEQRGHCCLPLLIFFTRTFNLCHSSCLDDESSRIRFAGDGVVVLPIQENDPACDATACNIKAVCEIMTDDGRGSEVTSANVD